MEKQIVFIKCFTDQNNFKVLNFAYLSEKNNYSS